LVFKFFSQTIIKVYVNGLLTLLVSIYTSQLIGEYTTTVCWSKRDSTISVDMDERERGRERGNCCPVGSMSQ
jgi:hypothetical protein